MDDEDRYSHSSGELNENDNDNDEVMEDVDVDVDADGGGDSNDDEDGDENDEEDAEGDGENENDGDADVDGDNENETENAGDGDGDGDGDDNDNENDGSDGDLDGGQRAAQESKSTASSTPKPTGPYRPSVRPEALTARLYDIVPTMAAPQATSINAMAITPDLRYWFTGGSDGYIRKYDGPGTINGKLALTVAQRHPFVDSVTKAGILMSYWENEEPAIPGRSDSEHVLSPVYSLAVQSEAVWLLSGLESGCINLQSVRHDEGKKIHCLQQHSNAVSVLTLAQDEKSVLSGSWDKNIFDWDLNTGQIKRRFEGSGGQISAIELRPACGDPVPSDADEPPPSDTISTNNSDAFFSTVIERAPALNGDSSMPLNGTLTNFEVAQEQASPAHESLFGGSDAGSLFGETAGEQPFGNDDDEYNENMSMMPGHENEGGMDHSADMAMAGIDTATVNKENSEPVPPSQPLLGDSMEMDVSFATTQEATLPSTVAIPEAEQPPLTSREAPHQDLKEEIVGDPTEIEPKVVSEPLQLPSPHFSQQIDPSQTSPHTFLSAAIDGTIRIWDRRAPNHVARIGNRPGVPPWCMSACWSPDGNMIFAGRRNGTVEEFDIRKAKRGWEPERIFKFPAGSGAISAVKPMVNGRHLVCASHDIMRLYDLRDSRAFKHSTVPFLIIPGPPRAGVISSLYIDPTSRFMLSAAGTRGWEGTCTEVLIGYEINVSSA